MHGGAADEAGDTSSRDHKSHVSPNASTVRQNRSRAILLHCHKGLRSCSPACVFMLAEKCIPFNVGEAVEDELNARARIGGHVLTLMVAFCVQKRS